jgi:two-component system nitrogen regulation response regulator GlnG
MPPAIQAKVLRLLQEQAFERVGGNETVRTDVRLIAATHRDLKDRSAEGRFRSDLYYRLGVFTIHLPPLRERGDDLPLLVGHYLRRYADELGREVREVAPEAMERLRCHGWPGNIRELQNVVKQALLRASGAVLLPAFLPEILGDRREPEPSSVPSGEDLGLTSFVRSRLDPDARTLYAETHRQTDRVLLTQVLEYADGSQQRAARLLGIARRTLRLRLRELGLHVARSVEAESPAAAWANAPAGWSVAGSDSIT